MRSAQSALRAVLAVATIQGTVAAAGIEWADAGTHPDPHVIHAAPDGHGESCSPEAPCALATAQLHARARIAEGNGATVELRGGTYPLPTPLLLEATDSGTPDRPTTYRAAPGEEPVLSAGVELTGWSRDPATGRWYVDAPGLATRQLFVDGRRAVRARDTDLAKDWTLTPIGYATTDARIAGWPDRDQLEVVVNTWWRTFRCGIATVAATPTGAELTVDDPCWQRASCGDARFAIQGTAPDWIENAVELLDHPGEWFHDRASDRLWYLPREGEDMTTARVVAGGGTALVRGAPGLHDLRIEGLTFSHTGWLGTDSGEGFVESQAGFHLSGPPDQVCDAPWVSIPAAVDLGPAQRIELRGNTFEHLGTAGLRLGSGSRDTKVAANTFRDIAGGGIGLGGIDEPDHHPTDPAVVTRANRIEGNVVTRTGQEYFGTVGIWVGYAQRTTVAHNELTDLPYTGISVGWGWGCVDVGGRPGACPPAYDSPSTLRDNRIERNLIEDVTQVNFDGGGIYTLSAQPGTIIRGNVVTGLRGLLNHPLYLDDGSRYLTVERNVIVGNDNTVMYKGGGHLFRGNYWQNRYVGDLWDWSDSYDGAGASTHDRAFYGASRMVGNHLIERLADAPASIVDQAGPVER